MSSPAETPSDGPVIDKTYRYRLVMYVVLVAWTAFLFWRDGVNQEENREQDRAIIERIETEAIERDEAIRAESARNDKTICERGNVLRQNIVTYVEGLAAGARNPEAGAAIVERAKRDFALTDCSVPLPTTTVPPPPGG